MSGGENGLIYCHAYALAILRHGFSLKKKQVGEGWKGGIMNVYLTRLQQIK